MSGVQKTFLGVSFQIMPTAGNISRKCQRHQMWVLSDELLSYLFPTRSFRYPQEVLTLSNVGDAQMRSLAVCISSCHVDVKEYHHEANVIKHGRCPDVVFSSLFLFATCQGVPPRSAIVIKRELCLDVLLSCLILCRSYRRQRIPRGSADVIARTTQP